MDTKNLPKFVRLHTLRYQPPGNPNRDDLGNPKQVTVGSTNRGRVSSQCRNFWIRNSEEFQNYLIGEKLGIRTQDVGRVVYDALWENGDVSEESTLNFDYAFDEKRSILMAVLVSHFMGKKDKISKGFCMTVFSQSAKLVDELDEVRNGSDRDEFGAFARSSDPYKKSHSPQHKLNDLFKTEASAFYHLHELERALEVSAEILSDLVQDWPSNKKERETVYKAVKEKLSTIYEDIDPSPDVALFGRMMASVVDAKVLGSVFPAHDITTNEVNIEFDMFTSTDDYREIGSKKDAGSDHLNTRSLLQGVFYSTLTVDVHKLCENLGGDVERTRKVLRAFLRTHCEVAPGAMRTSFGQNSVPFYIRIEKTDLAPITYHLAFSKPVSGDIATESVERIESFAGAYHRKNVSPKDRFDVTTWCHLPECELGGHIDEVWSQL